MYFWIKIINHAYYTDMANVIMKHRLYIGTDFCTLSQLITIITALLIFFFFNLSPFEEI